MKGPIRQRYERKNRVRKRRVGGRILWNEITVERAIETETGTRTE